jgi:hypothetical protein
MKRLFGYISVSLLLVPTFIASAGSSSEAATAGGDDEHYTIVWQGIGGATVEDDNIMEGLIEEKFNITYITMHESHSAREKINLLVQSGEGPDAMYAWTTHDSLFERGAYRTVPKDMIEANMPNYVDAMNELGPAGWAYFLAPGSTDQYWAVPRFQQQFGKEGNGAQHHIRYDWLENVGMTDFFRGAVDTSPPSKPNTFYWDKNVYDIDEFEAVLTSFRDDPDMDGRVDTVPYGIDGTGQVFGFRASLVLYAYGINNKISYNYDGDTIAPYNGDTTYMQANCPCFKDAIKHLQSWFSQGFMDKELPAIDTEQWRNRIASGVYGVCSFGCGVAGWNWDPDAAGHSQTAVREDGAKYLVWTGLSQNGTYRTKYNNAALPMGSPVVAFTVKHDVPDGKLARILQIYDYLNFDPEGRMFSVYGEEGVHWEWTGTTAQRSLFGGNAGSLVNRISQADANAGGWGHYDHDTTPLRYASRCEFCGALEGEYFNFYFTGEGAKNSLPPYREDVFNQTDFLTAYGNVRNTLDTIREEFYWKAITNANFDVDAEWDGYVKTWMDAGGADILAELNKLSYDIPGFKAGTISIESILGS